MRFGHLVHNFFASFSLVSQFLHKRRFHRNSDMNIHFFSLFLSCFAEKSEAASRSQQCKGETDTKSGRTRWAWYEAGQRSRAGL